MNQVVFRVEAIARAVHVDSAGATVESVNRYGQPVYEVRLICGGAVVNDYMAIGSSYKKTDSGFELSRWGSLVAAATDVSRPAAQVHPGNLIGRSVRVELAEDERGKQRVTAYRSAKV
jgi:hypothetical protein